MHKYCLPPLSLSHTHATAHTKIDRSIHVLDYCAAVNSMISEMSGDIKTAFTKTLIKAAEVQRDQINRKGHASAQITSRFSLIDLIFSNVLAEMFHSIISDFTV